MCNYILYQAQVPWLYGNGDYFVTCYFTVDEYPGAVAYYLYYNWDYNLPIPTTNNPADWTGWETNETTQKRTSAGTFDYNVWSGQDYDSSYPHFVVAKSASGEYTIPVGVMVYYYAT